MSWNCSSQPARVPRRAAWRAMVEFATLVRAGVKSILTHARRASVVRTGDGRGEASAPSNDAIGMCRMSPWQRGLDASAGCRPSPFSLDSRVIVSTHLYVKPWITARLPFTSESHPRRTQSLLTREVMIRETQSQSEKRTG